MNEALLKALGEILINALPTFFLVLLLYIYLRLTYFGPLARVLKDREAATEGARKEAQTALETASRKAAEYERALQDARSGIYKEQEEERRRWRQEQASAVEEARRQAQVRISDARGAIAAEAQAARRELIAQSEDLADRITVAVLEGKPA